MTPAIRFDGVSKRYGPLRVLSALDLEIEPGDSFGLVGVNGAGKTTCIKALLDFIDIDAGRIEIFGVPQTETRARERLAFLPERFTPPYYLRGRDFLGFYARLRRMEFDPGRAHALCEALDLAPEALARPVRDYSKGMAQKLGLVATFLSDRELMVLDEPMSGLDPKARLLVKAQMQSLKRRNRTLFFSTHMLSDVEELCDRMGVLHEGRLRFAGTPEQCRDAYNAPTLEQAYLSCISGTEASPLH